MKPSIFSFFFLFLTSLFQVSGQVDSKRLALIIGNADYQNANKLLNPVNDARAMKKALSQLGFDVMEYENLTQRNMKQVIDDFGRKLEGYEVGLFYYAGHGVQTGGNNYLIPVETDLSSEQQVEYDCVRADRVLGLMEYAKSKVNIVILDACRNNPFKRSWSRSAAGDGLAFMNAPSGSLIAYATAPGRTASDGSGGNGLYTEALLQNLFTPDLTILQVFQNVRKMVVENSGQHQIPWESTSLIGDFYFTKTHAGSNELQQTNKLVAKESSDVPVSNENTSHINSRAIWKSDEKIWSLLDNEKQVASRTIYSFTVDDLLAYDPETGITYLLKDYVNLTDNIFRPAEILSETDDSFWQSKDLRFYVYSKGKNITSEIIFSNADNDMLVYHPETNTTLLLENFYQLQDDKFRPAKLISMSDNVFWKSKDNLFLFFVKGDNVTGSVTSAPVNRDRLVYYEKTGSTYLLKDFYNLQDDQLRSAFLLSDQNDAYWTGFDNKYHIYVKGKDIASETTNSWKGNDLEVHHSTSQNTYLLKNFINLQDKQLRVALITKASNQAQWKAANNLFYLKDSNEEIQHKTVYAMAGNDLLVYYPTATKTYLLENYSNLQDNQWRTPRLLSSSRESVFWMSENNIYWLYVQGKQIAQETTSFPDGNDLVVNRASTGASYRLVNFYNLQDKILRPANIISFGSSETDQQNNTEPKKNIGNATWKAKDNFFWLYVNGDQIATRTTRCLSDNDLLVYDPVDNKSYLLEGYEAKQDDQLRTATILTAPENAFWRANSDGYYFYVKSELISSSTNIQSYWAGKDLIVYDKASGISYRLEDYNDHLDNQLRPAYVVKK